MSTRPAPVVSVVIPTRNGAAHLASQLDALTEQRLDGAFEVIVADNGSTDATVEIASGYVGRLDLKIVNASAAPGAGFARNTGVAAARAPRIVFLDDDDVVAPGYLAAMAAALDRFAFVAARVDARRLNPAWRVEMRGMEVLEGLRVGSTFPWAPGCALGITRAAFDAAGGFDAAVTPTGEDVDLCRRMHEAEVDLHLVADAVVWRRLRTTRRSLFNQGRRHAIGARSRREIELDRKRDRTGAGERDIRVRRPLRGLLGATRLAVLGRNRSERSHGIFLLGRVVGQVQAALRARS